jgi:hypothetical protein
MNADGLPEWIPPRWIDPQQRPQLNTESDASTHNTNSDDGDEPPPPHDQAPFLLQSGIRRRLPLSATFAWRCPLLHLNHRGSRELPGRDHA